VSPQPKNLHDAFLLKNLIDEAMLYVDAPRVGTFQVADELLERRGVSKRVLGEQGEEFLCSWLQARGG